MFAAHCGTVFLGQINPTLNLTTASCFWVLNLGITLWKYLLIKLPMHSHQFFNWPHPRHTGPRGSTIKGPGARHHRTPSEVLSPCLTGQSCFGKINVYKQVFVFYKAVLKVSCIKIVTWACKMIYNKSGVTVSEISLTSCSLISECFCLSHIWVITVLACVEETLSLTTYPLYCLVDNLFHGSLFLSEIN